MSENEPEKPKRGWGWLQWSVVLVVLGLLAYLVISFGCNLWVKRDQMRAANSPRDILGLLMTYASEHNGYFPDHGKDLAKFTSNEAFRSFFKEGLLGSDDEPAVGEDGFASGETIFGCPESRFTPDWKVGMPPDYAEALTPGENHWMMIAGLNNQSPAHYPLVMENSVEASWPPHWLPSSSKLSWLVSKIRSILPPRGRSWQGDTIIIGFCDASVRTMILERKNNQLHLPESILKPEGQEPLPTLKILDIEVSLPK